MMETAAKVLFAFYTLCIVGGAVSAVRSASLVRALLGLILALFGVAGMYLLLNAPLIAMMQLLIYVGAVVILIFFAIMLTRSPAGGEEQKPRPMRSYMIALFAAAFPGAVLFWTLVRHAPASIATPTEVPPAVLGQGLLEPYVLAFELISVILLVAMSGAVVLAFKHKRGDK
ncbi:NADH-ubiquinone/plastoquinone oxidoreductase chain 6 [Desulfovibrio sp. X2]|nr:NADH-ubiquinone/plastoquinone oxidoreductase chain 6 [Desulfovibrio sp. X2]